MSEEKSGLEKELDLPIAFDGNCKPISMRDYLDMDEAKRPTMFLDMDYDDKRLVAILRLIKRDYMEMYFLDKYRYDNKDAARAVMLDTNDGKHFLRLEENTAKKVLKKMSK